jgi:DNA-binding NtrC family response regulator
MKKEILIITNSESTKEIFKKYFSERYNISIYNSEEQAIKDSRNKLSNYIFIDLSFIKNEEKSSLIKEGLNKKFIPLLNHFPEAKKIIMSKKNEILDNTMAVKLGIDSYLTYPLIVEEIQYAIDLFHEQIKTEEVVCHNSKKTIIADSKYPLESSSIEMKIIIEKVQAVSKTNSNVLITGESGTGKSIMAKCIHNNSTRRNKKFISVHCGALPENLIESELFGHEKGSFTGAIRKKLGKFELADGGTIFLDEIGTISSVTQIKLLQVLQERFIQRVGGERDIEVDIRVIAATNSNLKDLVRKNIFREDLYYRLNVFEIEMPPLRKRTEDILQISLKILEEFNTEYGKNIINLDDNVIEAFLHYSWPGNIRELANFIERAYILEKSNILTAKNFPSNIFKVINSQESLPDVFSSLNLHAERSKVLNNFEKNYIKQLLKSSKGELKEAALISGVSVRQLHKLIAKHHIIRKSFVNGYSEYRMKN